MGCYYHFCSCQEARPSLTEQDIERVNKKREMDDMRREYVQEKGYKVEEMWECEWWQNFKTNDKIKNHVRTHFPYKRPLSTDSLLAKIKDGSLFGYVQCDLVVPDELKSKFANFPPIFKNTEVGRDDIGDYMKNYAIENEMLKHPQRMLISSFKLENGTVITPLFKFYMELGLQCTKNYRFVQYSPRKCFNNFVQSVVDARRGGDENPLSGVVVETMKPLGNSSYGYQIMDRSRHTITKNLNDKKLIRQSMNHCLRNLTQLRRTYMKWSYWSQPLSTENPSLLVFSFFSTQNWECWNSTITSLTISVMWKNLKSWRWIQTHFTWHLQKKICTIASNQIRGLLGKKWGRVIAEIPSRRMQNLITFLERVVVSIKNMISGSRVFSKKKLGAQKCSVYVVRHIAAMTTSQTNSNLAAKGWISGF